MIALSKTLDPADFDELAVELKLVDAHFTKDRPQHPMRRWEYAMALRACAQWGGLRADTPTFDVGGAGSPFYRMLGGYNHYVIDPDGGEPLDAYLRRPTAQFGQAVFCLSVLEHVDDLDRFLYHLGCLVAPGGLLFLTVDTCGCPSHCANMEVGDPPDQHHFHWMRKRIFGQADYQYIAEPLLDLGFSFFGGRDLLYRGETVFDYSFGSIALVKRP